MSSSIFYDRVLEHCSRCGVCVGEMDYPEHLAFMESDQLCFDCEPLGAMSKPEIFWNMLEGDRFLIGGLVLVRGSHFLFVEEMPHARAHERTHARGLSSYTYLNRTNKKGEFWDYEALYEVCQECCGYGSYLSGNDRVDCEKCRGEGVRVKAILLPRWILGLGCENV